MAIAIAEIYNEGLEVQPKTRSKTRGRPSVQGARAPGGKAPKVESVLENICRQSGLRGQGQGH